MQSTGPSVHAFSLPDRVGNKHDTTFIRPFLSILPNMPRLNAQEKLAYDNAKAAEKSRKDRDIAPDFPRHGDLARRGQCERSLRLFLERYFPVACNLEWSTTHLAIIARMEDAILHGGLFALCMSRGSGKTTLSVRAGIWVLLYGHRRYVALIAATEKKARDLLKDIKTELVFNERIVADFRSVAYPLVRLEGSARKAGGQLLAGKPTLIGWTADSLTFPTVPDWCCDGANVSGSHVSCVGITGSIRGQKHTLASGEIVRPEFALIDDCQTRESSESPSQSAERARIINADVLGLCGPDREIAAVACLTVIRVGDTSDMLLDRSVSPRWRGEKFRMLESMPTDVEAWERYAKVRRESLQRGGDGSEATELYRLNRDRMDAGAVASWPARFNENEISAIQAGMNIMIDDPESFASEYQGEPMRQDLGESSPVLAADQIAAKVNGVPRGTVPIGAEHLTCFCDVHDNLLYWVVVAWSPDFTGWVVDYNTHPDQHKRYFALRNASRTLAALYKPAGREGCIRAGIDALTSDLLSREWEREDGSLMRIGRCMIDAGYVPDVVYDACRHSVHAAVLMPSRGVGIGAKSRPISEYDRKRGDHIGYYWYVPKTTERLAMRHFRYDSNAWKSFVMSRFSVALGDPGSLSLFGHDAEQHRLFADHMTAEFPVRVSEQGRSIDEWRTRPNRPDQHYWDALCGAAATASYLGAVLSGTGAVKPVEKRRVRVSFAAEYAAARARENARPATQRDLYGR